MDEQRYVVAAVTDDERERAAAWSIGFGLQKVDGLTPSARAYELAELHVTGKIDYGTVYTELRQYHDDRPGGPEIGGRIGEADTAAARISQMIAEPGFTLSPAALLATHGRIFDGLLEDKRWEGRWRSVNLRKAEPVLQGASVEYASHAMIAATLAYDFEHERERVYARDLSDIDVTGQVVRFLSGVWQIHPFREGNTRTIAAYGIQYLRSLGVRVNNEPFAEHAVYFRDALVLDNAPRPHRDPEPLRRFVRALFDPSVALADLRGAMT